MEGGDWGGLVPSDPSGLWSRWSPHSCHPPGGREGSRDFRIETCRLHGIEMTGGHRNDPMTFISALEVVCLSLGGSDKIQLVLTHNDST